MCRHANLVATVAFVRTYKGAARAYERCDGDSRILQALRIMRESKSHQYNSKCTRNEPCSSLEATQPRPWRTPCSSKRAVGGPPIAPPHRSVASRSAVAHAALHEDLERLERVIVLDFKQDTRTHKDKLMQNHRVRKRLDSMQEAARKLVRRHDSFYLSLS